MRLSLKGSHLKPCGTFNHLRVLCKLMQTCSVLSVLSSSSVQGPSCSPPCCTPQAGSCLLLTCLRFANYSVP